MIEDKRPDCTQEFTRIWERLSRGDTSFEKLSESDHQHELLIQNLQINMVSLVKSMSKLTNALWGACVSVAGLGVAFIIWYIQSH